MSEGFNLGTAWVQVAPTFRGVRAAVQQELNGVDVGGVGTHWGSQLTSAVGGAFKTVGKIGVGALGAVGTVIAGMAAKGGIDRALNIENAQAKLKGLGHDSADISTIMQSALASVKGTAFGLGDAATVAASMSAAGVKSGQEMQTVLRTVADTAQISGRSMTDVGAIFGSVAARGKLQGDDMLQLMSAGVPVLQFLSTQLGVTTADVSDMVSKGQIDFATFQQAMEAGLGGAALAGGETFSGAMANARAALSRLGEAAATPILASLKDILNALTPAIDATSKALSPLIALLAEKLTSVTPRVVEGISSLVEKISGLSEKAQSLMSGGGLTGASSILAGLSPILGGVVGSMGPLLSGIPIVGGAFSSLTGPVGMVIGLISTMVKQSPELRDSLGGAMETVQGIASQAGPAIQTAFSIIGEAIGLAGDAIAPVIDGVSALLDLLATGDFTSKFRDAFHVEEDSPLVDLLTRVHDGVSGVLDLLVNGDFSGELASAFNVEEDSPVVDTVLSLRDGFVDLTQKIPGFVSGVVSGFASLTTTLIEHKGVVFTVLGIYAAIKAVQLGRAAVSAVTGIATQTAAWIANNVAVATSKAETVAIMGMYAKDFVVSAAKTVASLATQTASWAAATAATTAHAVALGAQKVATGVSTAAQWAFNAAMSANPITLVVVAVAALVAGLVLFFTKTEAGKRIWDTLVSAFHSFMDWIGPAWDALVRGIKTAIAIIVGVVLTPFMLAYKAFAAIFSWAWENVISPAWEAFKAGLTAIYTSVIQPILQAIVDGWNWMSGVAGAVWGAVSGAISTAWAAITGTISAGAQASFDWVAERFQAIVDFVTPIWEAVSGAISIAWATITGAVRAGAQAVFDWVADRFHAVEVGATIIWNAISAVISGVWTGIKTTADTAVHWVADTVNGAFDQLKTGVTCIWQGMSDAISSIWNGIKAIAAKPINFIIRTVYTDGLKHMVEAVADKLGLDLTLPTIKEIAYAGGGVMPGYTPGVDVHRFWSPTAGALALSGGEAIMRPEWTRAVGGPRAVSAMNAAARHGQAFADGGVFGSVGSWFADKARGIGAFLSDIAGSVLNLITTPVRNLMSGVGAGVFGDIGKGGIETALKALPEFFRKNTPSSAGLVGAAMKAVAQAIPYVWGGSTSAGLDCSGLVYWAAQNLGLGWPRLTAAGYQSSSVALGARNAVPGDLLFWGSPAHHVAIYAGSNMMVEEPRPGLNARYTSIWGSPTYGRYAGRNSRIAAAEYDEGGWLQPGLTTVVNNTSRPEPVFNQQQWNALLSNQAGGPAVVNVYDIDGKLIGTMRGEIKRELGSASRTSVQARMGAS